MNAHADDRSSDTMTKTGASSSAYKRFEEAMRTRKQILCTYNGRSRELCPIILGHSQGQEKALTYQFVGGSEKGLPAGGQWRCLWLSRRYEIFVSAMDLGMPVTATTGRKTASKSSISTSIRQAPTTQNVASKVAPPIDFS
jgi:hypothetical protein